MTQDMEHATKNIQGTYRENQNTNKLFDFTLTPICSEIDHHIQYENIMTRYYCEVCNKGGVMYRCINCEYSLCGPCHKDQCGAEELSNRFTYDSIRKTIIEFKDRLINDNISTIWCVGRSTGSNEIYFYNPNNHTVTYDYPISPVPPASPQPHREPKPPS